MWRMWRLLFSMLCGIRPALGASTSSLGACVRMERFCRASSRQWPCSPDAWTYKQFVEYYYKVLLMQPRMYPVPAPAMKLVKLAASFAERIPVNPPLVTADEFVRVSSCVCVCLLRVRSCVHTG
jgi:hypothetical protein